MIIGFHGAAGSGKDTAALILKDLGFEHLSFAEPLKQGAKHLFNLTDDQLYDPKIKEEIIRDSEGNSVWKIDGKEASPRLILQWLGTDILRNHVNKDFFVEHMKQRVKNCEKIVCTDVRFPNEAEFIRGQGGIIIKIIRSNHNKIELSGHSTELGLPKYLIDYTIKNDSTIEKLHEKVKLLCKFQ